MANRRQGFSFAALALGICLCAGISQAQIAGNKEPVEPTGRAGPRLYNKQLDDEAQSALDLAKDLAKGGLFDKELHNVDLLSQQSLARIFTSARRLALQRIAELATWKDVEDLKDHVGKSLSLNDFAGTQDLASAKTKLSEALDAAKKKTPPDKSKDAADSVFADFKAIGAGADSVLAAAEPIRQKFAGAGPATITHADIRAAGELTKLLTQFSDVYDRYKAATAAIPTAAGIVDQTRLDLICAELDHVVTLLKIWARRDAETSQTSELLAQLGRRLDCIRTSPNRAVNCPIPPAQRVETGASIEATLRQFVSLAKDAQTAADRNSDQPPGQRMKQFTDAEAERKKVRYVLESLYLSAAMASRGDLPVRLAESRMAQEEHRYAIRCNAIVARSYERIVGSGVERLALYYKGGVKPEVLAQLVQSMATLGLIPVVAVR
jgi:hypothetical protein